MPTAPPFAVQDSRRAPLVLTANDEVMIGLFGDSNAIGFDTSTASWSANASDLPTGAVGLGVIDDCSLWNKWTIAPNATRSSDADTGNGWHTCDAGLFDHGGATYRGLGQNAQSNGPETSLAYYLRLYFARIVGANVKIRVVKYGVAGSVLHDAPANPAAGWHPTGGATGAYNIYTARYLRPAINHRLVTSPVTGRLYWGGTFICNVGGTDAIDPGGVFTDVGDAEAVAGNMEALVSSVEAFLGLQPNTVYSLPPNTYENGASFAGYPNIGLVRSELRAWAQRRTAANRRTTAIEVADSERITDYLHYSQYGQWQHGRLLAQAAVAQGIRLERITEVP